MSVRKVTTCRNLFCGSSSVLAVASMLCHTLSLNRFSNFSSFVDNICVPSCFLEKVFVSIDLLFYKVLRTFRLDYWSVFWISTVSVIFFNSVFCVSSVY